MPPEGRRAVSARFGSITRRVRRLVGATSSGSLPRWMVDPFHAEDLKPTEPGDVIGPPDFVGVGLPKAGTSWWYSLLLDHPDVRPNRFGRKELQFFADPGYGANEPDRRELYRQSCARPAGCVCGEWTPTYLTYPLAIERLAATAPDARILLIVRDPIERVWSHLNHLDQRLAVLGLSGEPARFLWRYSLYPEAFQASVVAPGVRELLRLYPREQILAMQYEKCRAAPSAELARTFAFLGLQPVTNEQLTKPINARPHSLQPITSAERDQYAELLLADVMHVAELLPELDVSLWPNFRDRVDR